MVLIKNKKKTLRKKSERAHTFTVLILDFLCQKKYGIIFQFFLRNLQRMPIKITFK